jgi:aspartate-semialdehyde dehydrogenase
VPCDDNIGPLRSAHVSTYTTASGTGGEEGEATLTVQHAVLGKSALTLGRPRPLRGV